MVREKRESVYYIREKIRKRPNLSITNKNKYRNIPLMKRPTKYLKSTEAI